MSEIRPNDIDEADVIRRRAMSPAAKLVGEGDGHECPSYMESQPCDSRTLDILVRESTKLHLTV